jgi:hypothetical protein
VEASDSSLDRRVRQSSLPLLLYLQILISGCAPPTIDLESADYTIPDQTDWIDYGPIFAQGEFGEWDYQLFGAFTNTVIKRDGIFYLYYQGASGYRVDPDETVTWRAIGVATSHDGINFTKASENPVLIWYPSNNGEEGATSGAAALDSDNLIILFYGANTEESAETINADGRLAISTDGINFVDHGIALSHRDYSIWGSGDELFPIMAIHDNNRWYVYYLPNGTLQARKLGVAWGESPRNLAHSSGVKSGFSRVKAWGTAGFGEIGPDIYALFLNDVAQRKMEVRLMSLDQPHRLSEPVATYQFHNFQQGTVLLDKESNTWFMYYRSPGGYGVRLAPAGDIDKTPPGAPSAISLVSDVEGQVELNWQPASDDETGIAQYLVYRDGVAVATLKGGQYIDRGLDEKRTYSYEMSAVNYHGREGDRSAPLLVTTPEDRSPPRVVSTGANSLENRIIINFDEKIDPVSGENLESCQLEGFRIDEATVGEDEQSVTLKTSFTKPVQTVRLRILSIKDQSRASNRLIMTDLIRVTATPFEALYGAWLFDEGEGDTAIDTSNYGNDGSLIYTDLPGPQWVDGRSGTALSFDGFDDQVTVEGAGLLRDVTDGSFTFSSWARPGDYPPNSTVNDSDFTIIARDYSGLYYDADGRFRAQIKLADGDLVSLSSKPHDPGDWYHVAMVIDAEANTLRLYVNGQETEKSPLVYAGARAELDRFPFYIGTSEPLDQRYEYRFEGALDEVLIFGQALAGSAIKLLYSASR